MPSVRPREVSFAADRQRRNNRTLTEGTKKQRRNAADSFECDQEAIKVRDYVLNLKFELIRNGSEPNYREYYLARYVNPVLQLIRLSMEVPELKRKIAFLEQAKAIQKPMAPRDFNKKFREVSRMWDSNQKAREFSGLGLADEAKKVFEFMKKDFKGDPIEKAVMLVSIAETAFELDMKLYASESYKAANRFLLSIHPSQPSKRFIELSQRARALLKKIEAAEKIRRK